MRWDRLFADLEASRRDEDALERDALADELADEEWASAGSRDLIWGEVVLDVLGTDPVTGTVARTTGDFFVLELGGDDVVVARHAVLGWRGGAGRAPEPDGVTARLGWRQLFRAGRDDGMPLRCTRVDGSVLAGGVRAVGADALCLETAAGPTWVPFSAIATVRAGRG